jgi:eukaryotic-like serine/threonine-protein kinase
VLDETLPIARQITDALGAAHDQGIVHRDLKPANIKVRLDGTVKVLDFGLARAAEPAAAGTAPGLSLSPTMTSPAMTEAGMLLGTAPYMSPEQARGKAVDKRTDIWAFGCELFEMVTGRRAFGGEDVTETIAAIMRDQPELGAAPPQLRRLLARCLEKDVRRRLRDIGDAWTLIDDDGPRDRATAVAPLWRRALPWGVTAAAVLVAGVVSTVHFSETPALPRPVRFQLEAPEEAGSATPTISPDGTRIVYRSGGQIWVRELADPEPRAIASTDRTVGRLFWSADSRFVVYAAVGKLLRAPVAGGPSQTVLDPVSRFLAAGFGLPGGGVVVTSAVSNQDAAETVLIEARGSRQLAGVRGFSMNGGASPLPDGKRFVFSVLEPEAQRGVYVASVDGAAPERLLLDASDVAYVPSVNRRDEGYLLLLRQGTLVALPVDAARLQARGEAIALATGVSSFTASAADSLVYRAATGRRLTWYDRRGTSTGTAWSPGPYNEIALSPDATRVVVVRANGPTTWVHEFARESSTRVGATLPVLIKPLWSPDGSQILALSSRSGQSEFYRIPADGSSAEDVVFRTPTTAFPTSWSHDGAWLLYTSVDPRTKDDLWVLPMTPGATAKPEPFLVTDNRENAAMFSPDGRAVAYVSDESGTSNVYVRSFPSSGGRKWQVSTAGGYQPRWRGDGTELLFMSATGQLMRADITPGLAVAPGTPTILFQTAVFGGGESLNNWYWDMTPDSQRFLINNVIGSADPSALNVVLNWQAGLAR